MDFELTDDQVSLQEAIRAFCDGRFPPDVVRNIEHAGARLDRDLWHELGDTGVFSLRVPEDDGGLGLGVSEAVLVFEELGRALVPGPLVATELAARISPEAAAGHVVVGLVERDDGVIVLEHPADLDALLVLDADGIHLVDPDVDRRRRRRATARRAHADPSRHRRVARRRAGRWTRGGRATSPRRSRAHERAANSASPRAPSSSRPSTPRSASSSAGPSVRSRR